MFTRVALEKLPLCALGLPRARRGSLEGASCTAALFRINMGPQWVIRSNFVFALGAGCSHRAGVHAGMTLLGTGFGCVGQRLRVTAGSAVGVILAFCFGCAFPFARMSRSFVKRAAVRSRVC